MPYFTGLTFARVAHNLVETISMDMTETSINSLMEQVLREKHGQTGLPSPTPQQSSCVIWKLPESSALGLSWRFYYLRIADYIIGYWGSTHPSVLFLFQRLRVVEDTENPTPLILICSFHPRVMEDNSHLISIERALIILENPRVLGVPCQSTGKY